jgi:hypothetical protein
MNGTMNSATQGTMPKEQNDDKKILLNKKVDGYTTKEQLKNLL